MAESLLAIWQQAVVTLARSSAARSSGAGETRGLSPTTGPPWGPRPTHGGGKSPRPTSFDSRATAVLSSRRTGVRVARICVRPSLEIVSCARCESRIVLYFVDTSPFVTFSCRFFFFVFFLFLFVLFVESASRTIYRLTRFASGIDSLDRFLRMEKGTYVRGENRSKTDEGSRALERVSAARYTKRVF